VPLPFPPPALRPSPPSGGLGRAYQYKREEEVAPEEMQAFTRYHPDDGGLPPTLVVVAVLLLALAGASLRGRGRAKGMRAAPVDLRTLSSHRGGPR
jgi:hypothetical protein